MKLLVLGASGATGRLVVDQALAAGHTVRALVRSADKLTVAHPSLEVVTGQATDPGDVAQAMTGVEGVISTLGAAKGTVTADSTRAILAGADQTGVARVVVLSTFAVLRDRLSRPATVMSKLAMAAVVKDKSAGEQLLRESGLDYTIVHSTRLTNGAASGSAAIVADGQKLRLGNSISRADVAAWLLGALDDPTYTRRDLAITA